MKKFNYRRILVIVGNVILAIIIVIGILVGISLLPFKNNFKLLAVTSGSMQPAIPLGSLVVVKPAAEYKVGDIVTFTTPGATSKKQTTTHRIIEVTDSDGFEYYHTKGDANDTPDAQIITKDQIIGKYRFSIALLGYLLGYIKTLPGLILIIIIPATVIIYEEIKKIVREAKKIKNKKISNSKKKSSQKRRKNGKNNK